MAGGWFSQAGRIKQWWVTGMRMKQPFQAVINLDLKEGPLDGRSPANLRNRCLGSSGVASKTQSGLCTFTTTGES